MDNLFPLVPLIIFLPVLGLLVNIAFGGRMGEKAIGAVASAASGHFVLFQHGYAKTAAGQAGSGGNSTDPGPDHNGSGFVCHLVSMRSL